MGNIFTIKHGSSVPQAGALKPYELGYCTENGLLYIGLENNGIQSFIGSDSNNSSQGVPLYLAGGVLKESTKIVVPSENWGDSINNAPNEDLTEGQLFFVIAE